MAELIGSSKFSFCELIETGTDLNKLTKDGIYSFNSIDVINGPNSLTTFSLLISHKSAGGVQVIFNRVSNTIHKRQYGGDGWSEWVELLRL